MRFSLNKCLLTLVAAASLLVVASPLHAQKATSLDELLSLMKQSKVVEGSEHKKREAQFRREKSKRSSLLAEAERSKAKEEARSAKLEADYEAQDLKIKALREQRAERMGSLDELFGHLKTAAGDLQTSLKTSLISLQYPGREKFAAELSKKLENETSIPSMEEVEMLIYEIQRETLEAGKVVKFTTTVAAADGTETQTEVVRLGNYGVVADGNYVFFDSQEGGLQMPTTQPSGLPSAGDVENASSGLTMAAVDPTLPLGGQIMQIMVDRPDLKKRFEQGGLVGAIIIIGLGGVGILLVLWRFLALGAIGAKVSSQLKAKKAKTNNPLGRVLKVAEDNPGIDGESLELKLEEAVLKERPSIESGLNMIKIISMVAPLMGLLGTVVGMIQTFQAITDYGAGDPKLMAGGISAALVTTVCGLIVAIPTVFMHTILSGKAKRLIHILDEQSAGIIAENAEAK